MLSKLSKVPSINCLLIVFISYSFFSLNTIIAQSKEEDFLYDFVKSEQKVKSCIVEFYSIDKQSESKELVLQTHRYPKFDHNGVKSEYSKNGRKIKEIKFDSKDKILWSADYNYSSNGKISSIIEIDNKKKLRWKSIFKYDNNGNRIEYKELMGDSSVYVYTTYKYDSLNLKKEKEEQIFDSVRKKTKIVYTYDSAQYNIKKMLYSLDKFTQEIRSTYKLKAKLDKRKTLIADTIYSGIGSPNRIVGYEFENDKVISETYMDMLGEEKERESMRYEYDVDDNDNWIEKKIYKGDVLIHKTLRKIEYYEDADNKS